MKPKLILVLCFALPLFCMAQNALARHYSYDASGNRTICAVIHLYSPAGAARSAERGTFSSG